MSVVKVQLLIIVFCYLFLQSHELVPLASEENSIIRATETIIRNITNTLFSQLNLRGTKLNRKLRRLITVHSFLTSVTLQDHKNLNEIVRLSRSDNLNVKNETENLIELLNEILDEDLNVTDSIYFDPDENIIKYVDEFLTNVDGLKESIGLNNDYESLEIKNEIINVLVKNYTATFNVTQKDVKANTTQDFLLENEFWMPYTRRIYQGRKTKIRHFPFVASIQFFNSFQCGGSIIKSDLVITAASCLQLAWNNRFFRENPAFLSVRVGSNFYNGGGDNIAVLEVYFHPDYTPKTLRNNIAVLRLHRHLKFRKSKTRMKKIDIDRHDHALPVTTDGITVIGWGARGLSNIVNNPWENQIAYAVLDVYGLPECQEVYSKEYVTQKNFCAGFISKGGGACNHDVGGPGIVSGILAGIISFGSPVCGTPDTPTVFTKVGFYADWIDEIMEQEVPIIKTRTTLRNHLIFTEPPPHLLPTRLVMVPILPIDTDQTTTAIPIQEVEDLRSLRDEDLFKDYISTMFKNSKLRHNEDLTSDDNEQKVKVQQLQQLDVEAKKEENDLLLQFERLKKDLGQESEDLSEGKVQNVDEQHIRPIDDNVKKFKEHQIQPLEVKTDKAKKKLALQLKQLNISLDVPDLLNDIKAHKEISNFESVTKRSKKYTILEDASRTSDETDDSIEENIGKLLDNINISSRSEESTHVSKEIIERITRIEPYQPTTANYKAKQRTRKLKGTKKDTNYVEEKKDVMKNEDIKKEENVMTLLYLTDDENDNSGEDGLSIAVDGFQDKNFRNNITNAVLEFMSKSDIRELLNEAINDMTKIKNLKDL